MSLTTVIYLTTAALAAVLVLIVMVTRRVIRTVPGGVADARAVAQLAAEIKRANDLAEQRIATLEQRVAALEQRGAAPPAGSLSP